MNITTPYLLRSFILCSLLVLLSCRGTEEQGRAGGSGEQQPGSGQLPYTQFPSGAEVPDNRYVDTYNILIFGNSHVRSNNLGGILQDLIRAGRPDAKVQHVLAKGSYFLDERITTHSDLLLLQSGSWTHVILQGQKYSTSGLYSYPTDASTFWLKAVKAQNATPVLFPEHGQRDNSTEGARVYALHLSIVATEPGCVAPVGLAWDRALQQDPQLILHEEDGNHAALAGTFLTALVFYQSITGNNAELLPVFPRLGLSAQDQHLLRQTAAATLQQFQPCPFSYAYIHAKK